MIIVGAPEPKMKGTETSVSRLLQQILTHLAISNGNQGVLLLAAIIHLKIKLGISALATSFSIMVKCELQKMKAIG